MKFRIKFRVQCLFLIMLGMVLCLGGCGSNPILSASSVPATDSSASSVVTPQQVISYVEPWLQAATTIAGAVAGSGIVNSTALTDGIKVASAALSAFKTTPTADTLNTLNAAMAPVYSQATVANSGSATPASSK